SSSRIEPLITQGRMVQANALLGFPYSVSGVIVHGFRRGSELLKIPTANLEVDYEYVLPEIGVYAGLVMVENNLYPAMINVGKNPTFNNQTMTVEAHILDFDRDIYDRKARFFFLEKTRGEIKFDHFNQLKDQLHQDIQATRQVLKSHGEMIDAARNIWLKVSL
ncbi:MAG: riboflavin biosynthesis protein RibF, partial [Erysipelotrichaceae bacterium]|nr:riboflavin biosynthesis protein RibF [Erysipelotrichaceae bacterium]